MQDRTPQIAETTCSATPIGTTTVSRARYPAEAVLQALRIHKKLSFEEAALRACSFTWAVAEASKATEKAFVLDVLLDLAHIGVATLESDGVFVFHPTPTAAVPSPEPVEYPNVTFIEYAIKRTTRP